MTIEYTVPGNQKEPEYIARDLEIKEHFGEDFLKLEKAFFSPEGLAFLKDSYRKVDAMIEAEREADIRRNSLDSFIQYK